MITANADVRTVEDRDGAAILDIGRGLISTLNPTGAYIWRGLENGETVATIIASLVRETGEEPVIVACDVQDFIEALREAHLLAH